MNSRFSSSTSKWPAQTSNSLLSLTPPRPSKPPTRSNKDADSASLKGAPAAPPAPRLPEFVASLPSPVLESPARKAAASEDAGPTVEPPIPKSTTREQISYSQHAPALTRPSPIAEAASWERSYFPYVASTVKPPFLTRSKAIASKPSLIAEFPAWEGVYFNDAAPTVEPPILTRSKPIAEGKEKDALDAAVDPVELPGEENTENAAKTVVARLAVVFGNVQQYRRLLSCRGSEAQRLLDTFQMLLDTPRLTAKFRRNLLVATQRLSKRAGLYPTCYNLQGVELESEHPVAAGSFADIYKGRLLGQIVCMKVIRLYQTSHVASFLQQFSAEAILWGQLSHPNLLPIYGLYWYMNRLSLVSPWMEHGDVISFLHQHPDADRSLLVLDVTSGVAYLHKHDIVHGDLKGANVLVNDSMRACVADFGLSAVSDANILHWTSHSSAASKGGSVRWQAPELFDIDTDDVVYNSKQSDVYAVGCVAYEVFTGNVPFFEVPRDPSVMRKVQTGAQPSRPPESSPAWGAWGLTWSHWSLMMTCWRADPESRPSMDTVAAHFSFHKLWDYRPAASVKTVSRARFRDSVSARYELPSMDEVKSILEGVVVNSDSSSSGGPQSFGHSGGEGGKTSPQLPSPASGASSRNGMDQNPPIKTLYVGNLPTSPPPPGFPQDYLEESLRELFSARAGFCRLCFRQKSNGPMCFVEFEDTPYATKTLNDLYGNTLKGLVDGGIRLSYSKNPLGVRIPTSAGTGPSLQHQ